MTARGRIVALSVTFISIAINAAYGSDKNGNKTIWKCCPNNLVLKIPNNVYVCDNAPLNVTLDFSDLYIYTNNAEKTTHKIEDVYKILQPKSAKKINQIRIYTLQFFLTEENLLIRDYLPNSIPRWQNVDREKFCLDYMMTKDKKNKTQFKHVFIVDDTQKPYNPSEYYIKIGALLVSCAFLLIILIVYCLLPELRNLAGKVMMAYAGSLLCAYTLLATFMITLVTPKNYAITKTFCVALSSSTYFFFMASFLWMNVMSWDLWYSFRRLLDFRRPYRTVSPYTFHVYCAYAFGMSFGLALVFVMLNEYPIPGVISPSIPGRGCFIDEPEKMLYFYVPMLILISCNWIFFILTAYNFWQYDNGNKILNTRNSTSQANATRQRFIMYVKFSLLMGISFVLEAISSKAPELSVWYITDMYNMLIGVAFFIILVCKRRILRKLLKKLRLCGNSEGLKITSSKGANTNGSKSYSYQSDKPEP